MVEGWRCSGECCLGMRVVSSSGCNLVEGKVNPPVVWLIIRPAHRSVVLKSSSCVDERRDDDSAWWEMIDVQAGALIY